MASRTSLCSTVVSYLLTLWAPTRKLWRQAAAEWGCPHLILPAQENRLYLLEAEALQSLHLRGGSMSPGVSDCVCVSGGCPNKSTQTRRLKTTGNFLTVLQGRSLWGRAFPASYCFWWPTVSFGLWPRHSHLSCFHMAPTLYVSVSQIFLFLSYKGTCQWIFSLLEIQEDLMLKSLIISIKMCFQISSHS